MAKCKWCHEPGEVNQYGYCDDCNDAIRKDIIERKSQLEELAKQAGPDLPEEEKGKILDAVLECRSALWEYKDKGVPFFKSDIDAMCEIVYAKMGIPFEFWRKPQSPKSKVLVQWLAGIAAVVLIIALGADGYQKRAMINDLSVQLTAANSIVEAQNIQIEELQTMVQELKDKLVPKKKSFSLSSGNYVAGEDFAAGTYDILATEGNGNVYSDNMYDGGINAVMGTDNEMGFYERQYKNIILPEGTTLTIDGVTVKLTLK